MGPTREFPRDRLAFNKSRLKYKKMLNWTLILFFKLIKPKFRDKMLPENFIKFN